MKTIAQSKEVGSIAQERQRPRRRACRDREGSNAFEGFMSMFCGSVFFEHEVHHTLHPFRRFVGWELVLRETEEKVGVIEDVVRLDEGDLAGNTYFRVVQKDFAIQHFIPIVKEMIPAYKPDLHHVLLTPPCGLLELGIQQAKLEKLKEQLEPFTHVKDNTTRLALSQPTMPTKTELENEGRLDLIEMIREAGGFHFVAGIFGWKSYRKPWGFWDDIENLDREIGFFVSASWIEEDGLNGSYFYNTAINRIQWETPKFQDVLSLDGSTVVVENPDQRFMPSRIGVVNRNRWDLHHAILSHGGYRTVTEALERVPVTRTSKPLSIIAPALDVVHVFLEKHKIQSLPYLPVFKSYKDPTILEALEDIGGIKVAARYLNLPCDHKPRPNARKRGPSMQKWRTVDAAAACISSFLQTESNSKDKPFRLPTQNELIQANRYDLKYAIEKFGRFEIEQFLSKV